MKAIETVHSGYKFRSRLEARWAIFFESLHIPYQYEVEGFDLDNAGWYLPDFFFPEGLWNCACNFQSLKNSGDYPPEEWGEIKPRHFTIDHKMEMKMQHLSLHTGHTVSLFCGDPYHQSFCIYRCHRFGGKVIQATFGECYYCHAIAILQIPTHTSYCRHCIYHINNSKGLNEITLKISTQRLDAAYLQARQARFEHNKDNSMKIISNTHKPPQYTLCDGIQGAIERWICGCLAWYSVTPGPAAMQHIHEEAGKAAQHFLLESVHAVQVNIPYLSANAEGPIHFSREISRDTLKAFST